MTRIITILFLFVSTWAGAQHGMLLAKPAAGGGTTYLLDTYTGAAVAYGMNKLKSTATNCVTILRASDNDTLVVGFSGDDFDSSAATTFVSSGHGYVIRWYDQSGNGVHLAQSDTSKAPRIIINGTLNTEAGIAALKFDGTSDYLETATFTLTSQPITRFHAFAWVAKSGGMVVSSGATFGREVNFLLAGGAGLYWRVDSGTAVDYTGAPETVANSRTYLASVLFNSTASNLWIDGTDYGSSSTGTEQIEKLRIGANRIGTGLASMNMHLVVSYHSDQSANRTGIESNINTYYSIY